MLLDIYVCHVNIALSMLRLICVEDLASMIEGHCIDFKSRQRAA
jgi:hypothetical protein